MLTSKQAIEVCLPAELRTNGIQALVGEAGFCKRLADIEAPDFYHPYQQDAARFEISALDASIELILVTDIDLGLSISPATMETGMTAATANRELRYYCEGVKDQVLSSLTWPSLANFLTGWLSLLTETTPGDVCIIHLMYAQDLILANDVSEDWLVQNLRSARSLAAATDLLATKREDENCASSY